MIKKERLPELEECPTGALLLGLQQIIADVHAVKCRLGLDGPQAAALALTQEDIDNFRYLIAELEARKVITLH